MSRVARLIGYGIILVSVSIVTALPSFQLIEMAWLDREFAILRELGLTIASDDVCIVGIDDRDLDSLGTPIALLHQPLADFLAATALAKPKAVGLDIVFPERSFDSLKPGLDLALAKGIATAKHKAPLILGVGIESDGTARPLHPLFATLAGQDGMGSVIVTNDIDGTVRKYKEELGENSALLPTLTGQIARALGIPLTAGYINYGVRRMSR